MAGVHAARREDSQGVEVLGLEPSPLWGEGWERGSRLPKKDKVQLDRAKAMRTEMTEPEKRLWYYVRAKRLNGVKFTHQVLAGPFIVDFAARMLKLAIELDGDSHGHQVDYDKRRTASLERAGWRVLRFSNYDVMTNIEGVLETIMQALNTAPLPDPLPIGERVI